jgi:hypothetical protein
MTSLRSTERRLPWGIRALVLLLFCFMFFGAILHAAFSGHFVFFYAAQYKQVGWVAFPCLLAVFAGLLALPQVTAPMRAKHPTRWVRWFFSYPLFVGALAGMTVLAPLGWLAATTWAFGTEREPLRATVVSVEPLGSGKGCGQHVTLQVLSTRATLCLTNHYAGPPLRAQQEVRISVRASAAGLLLERID